MNEACTLTNIPMKDITNKTTTKKLNYSVFLLQNSHLIQCVTSRFFKTIREI